MPVIHFADEPSVVDAEFSCLRGVMSCGLITSVSKGMVVCRMYQL
jgi:hypothetical protein